MSISREYSHSHPSTGDPGESGSISKSKYESAVSLVIDVGPLRGCISVIADVVSILLLLLIHDVLGESVSPSG